MKKSICLMIAVVFAFSFHLAAQCSSSRSYNLAHYNPVKKSCCSKSTGAKTHSVTKPIVLSKPMVPYVESSYLLGMCGEKNEVAFTAGVEKWMSKHWSVSGDVHIYNTDYSMMCDVYNEGTYKLVIPAIKLKFDPGKRYKGFFISAGIGYAFAKDRGIEIEYVENPATGVKTQGTVTQGNWDYNSLAPNFSWGFAMKVFRFPVTISNTNYFAKTSWFEDYNGYTDISTGIGLKLGLVQVKKERKNCAGNKTKHEN